MYNIHSILFNKYYRRNKYMDTYNHRENKYIIMGCDTNRRLHQLKEEGKILY